MEYTAFPHLSGSSRGRHTGEAFGAFPV